MEEKKKKTRTMTPEMLEKLKIAREKALEVKKKLKEGGDAEKLKHYQEKLEKKTKKKKETPKLDIEPSEEPVEEEEVKAGEQKEEVKAGEIAPDTIKEEVIEEEVKEEELKEEPPPKPKYNKGVKGEVPLAKPKPKPPPESDSESEDEKIIYIKKKKYNKQKPHKQEQVTQQNYPQLHQAFQQPKPQINPYLQFGYSRFGSRF